MKSIISALAIAAALSLSPALAKDWKKELAAPLVKITGNKMVYEELELCTVAGTKGQEASSFQVKTRSEAPNTKFISRDNFVAITAAMNMTILQQFGEIECKSLEGAIGKPDFEINLYMAEGGLQVEFTNTGTGQKTRNTVRWEEMFSE